MLSTWPSHNPSRHVKYRYARFFVPFVPTIEYIPYQFLLMSLNPAHLTLQHVFAGFFRRISTGMHGIAHRSVAGYLWTLSSIRRHLAKQAPLPLHALSTSQSGQSHPDLPSNPSPEPVLDPRSGSSTSLHPSAPEIDVSWHDEPRVSLSSVYPNIWP